MTPDPHQLPARTIRPRRAARHSPFGQVLAVPPRSLVVLAGLPGAGERLERTGGMSFVEDVLVLSREVARSTGAVVVSPAGISLQRPLVWAA